jgi:hypothetical protein
MKTNQVMIREDGFVQRTKDGYFNSSMLLSLWNSKSGQNKQLSNFQKIEQTKSFINQLKKEGIEQPFIAGRGSGESSGTWMHPKLFIDFAMWLSVEFKSKVIDMVLDGLILSRNDAGDYYREMCATIMEVYIDKNGCKPPALIYANEANMLKQIANLDIDRNEMTEKDLSRLTMLQKVNSTLIKKNIGVDSRKKHLSIINESMM